MSQTQKKMLEEIRKKRQTMIESANNSGFTSEATLRYSEELDQLIYEYQQSFNRDNRQHEEVKFTFKKMIMVRRKVLLKA